MSNLLSFMPIPASKMLGYPSKATTVLVYIIAA